MPNQNLNLKESMAIGAIWMTGLRLSQRLIGLVSMVILARLLTPDDFGLVAIAMSFFALIDIFSRLGLETVLIQKKSPSKEHYDTAWTLNFFFGILSATILILISGFVADFYNNQEIQTILWVISFLFLLNGIKNIGVVDFQKNLTFDKEFKFYLIPKFISFFITIALALVYRNYWALVIGNVAWRTLEILMSYYMHAFRPTFCLSKAGDLFGFSKWLIINNIFTFLLRRLPDLILGKMISLQAVAIFSLASEVGKMTTTEIVANLNRAIFPGYSKISDDPEKLKTLYSESIQIIAIIVTPLGVGIALVSPFLVPLLLGGQWLMVIEPLVYLSLGGSITALNSNGNYVYLSLGKPKIITGMMILRCLALAGSMYPLILINGVTGAAQAFLLTSIVSLIASNLVIKKVLKISFMRQQYFYLKPVLSTLIMAASVSIFIHYNDFNNLTFLISCSLIGGIVYFSSIYLLWLLAGKKGPEKKVIEFILTKVRRN